MVKVKMDATSQNRANVARFSSYGRSIAKCRRTMNYFLFEEIARYISFGIPGGFWLEERCLHKLIGFYLTSQKA